MIWKPNLKSQQRFNATIMLGKEEVITDDKDAILLVLKNRLDNTGYVRLKDDWQNSKFIEFRNRTTSMIHTRLAVICRSLWILIFRIKKKSKNN
jgi:hypothetical protein